MRSIVLFAAVVLVAAGIVPRLLDGMNGPAAMSTDDANATAPAMSSSTVSSSTVTIRRGRNGHYQVDAVVDGRHVDFLVDTGATSIVLTSEDAAKLGIFPAARDYAGLAQTANGTVRFARAELNRVEIGGIVVRNVAATVLPEGVLAQSLLGMSFLSRVRWQQERDRLVLEQ
ncbi:MAG TPA: TIGR02281 family clan AA aspartic protease [Xanthobacteraceae bacterium]|jgi:aspartyl protease family protein|nr:TIGR02281 family clan AA aspartic protease [Xanthobacteraceae bacterium]